MNAEECVVDEPDNDEAADDQTNAEQHVADKPDNDEAADDDSNDQASDEPDDAGNVK